MRRLLLGLSMAILVMAKPELYREKEDFQYSRSSSDEGSKSGYYDAQRGNMGGNYERAHNMDVLAQHQMGGLVKQVEGELGDGSKTRTGSVFTAANSQGIYGSGRYDLSNVAGRNFQEGASFYDSQSHLSAGSHAHSSQYSAQNNARYNTDSLSHSSGLGGYHQSDNLQEAQNSYGAREYEHGSHSQRSSKYYLQSGNQGSSDYERSNLNQLDLTSNNIGAGPQNRFVSQVPVRIVVRPGTRVAIPLATQTHATSYDHSNVNSEAEVLSSGDQQTAFRPSGDAKHYESSYSYHKEWEKHNTKPVAVPLGTPVVPISKNSELYDETRLQNGYTQNAGYNLASSHVRQQAGFNSQHSALSSESQHEADYNTRQHTATSNINSHETGYNARQHTASSNINSNAYTNSGYNSLANSYSDVTGAITSKPKSYHSSYSYHKSWERQGDPYVIVPSTNVDGQTSQRLTDYSGSQGEYSSHNYGSRNLHKTYSVKDCVIECDPNSHIRVARSYGSKPAQFEEQNQNTQHGQEANVEQQSQNLWDDLGQQTQTQFDRLEDLGQQTQNWEQVQDAGQQVQNNWENLEDLGQQTQDTWQQTQDAGQQVQNKWDNLQNLAQQTQNTREQQTQDAGQQVQNKWDNLENLAQQTQNTWEQQTQDAGQPVQNKWEKIEDLGQQTQNTWEPSQTGGQQTENKWELGQQAEISNGWNNLEAFGQHAEKGQDEQTPDRWDTQSQDGVTKPIEVEGQHDLAQWDQSDKYDHHVPQQTEHDEFDNSQAFNNQDALGRWPNQNTAQEQQSQALDLNQETQGSDFDYLQSFANQNVFAQSINHDESQGQALQPEDLSQQTQGFENPFEKEFNHDQSPSQNTESNEQLGPKNTGSLNDLWGKLDNLDGDFVPSISPSQTQNTDNLQSFSFDSLWGNIDDLDGNVAPSMAHTNVPQNIDSTQNSSTQSSDFNLNQQSLFSNNISSHDFEGYQITKSQNQGKDTIEDGTKKSTTENNFKVPDVPADDKRITTTTQESHEGKARKSDFGRGDIGPEDTFMDLSTSTTPRSSKKDDSLSYTYTNENNYNKQNRNDEKNKSEETNFFNVQVQDVQMNEQKHIFVEETEKTNPKTTDMPYKDDLQNQKKQSDKPDKHVEENVEEPSAIEQEFETQNLQHNEPNFGYIEQQSVQHQLSTQEQNYEFGTLNEKMPTTWNQYPNHPNVADSQFVDFSQVNQQWNFQQQNIQQQSADSYQQHQHLQSQDKSTGDLYQNNMDSLPDFEQQNVKSEFEVLPVVEKEEQVVRKDYAESFGQQASTNNLSKDVVTTSEPVTEKPGFWKSVGSKLSSAKNKVASWFSS